MGRPGKTRDTANSRPVARPGVRNSAARRAQATRAASLAQADVGSAAERKDLSSEIASNQKSILARVVGLMFEERALVGLVFLPVIAGAFWVVWTKAWVPPTLKEIIARLPVISVQAKGTIVAVAAGDQAKRMSAEAATSASLGAAIQPATAAPSERGDAVALLAPVAPEDEAQMVLPDGFVSAIDREALAFVGRERPCTVEEAEFAGMEPASEIFDGSDQSSDPHFGVKLAAAAVAQTGDFVVYTDRYRKLSFPMGDVSALYGVCTDVIIRAYRSVGIDLQAAVKRSGVGSGDPSIDHRRTETLRRFFARNGTDIAVSDFPEDYLPGDIVTYHRPQNSGSQSHIAIVTDMISRSGRPMIVHNRGWGPQIEDGLFVDRITGHYRYRGGLAQPRGKTQAKADKLPALKVITRKLRKAGKSSPRASKSVVQLSEGGTGAGTPGSAPNSTAPANAPVSTP